MSTPNEKDNESIINSIIALEGGFVNDKEDRGKATIYGISEKSNPEAWKNGPPTESQARAIYEQKYLKGPGFDKINNIKLRHFLTDFAVHSGPMLAIQYLQRAVGCKDDGVLGDRTIAAVDRYDPVKLLNGLVVERVKMIGRIVQKNPSQAKYLNGWFDRAFQFMVI